MPDSWRYLGASTVDLLRFFFYSHATLPQKVVNAFNRELRAHLCDVTIRCFHGRCATIIFRI